MIFISNIYRIQMLMGSNMVGPGIPWNLRATCWLGAVGATISKVP